MNSSEFDKRSILDSLKEVLNGKMTVKYFLRLFDVSIYNKDTYHTFKKTLQR